MNKVEYLLEQAARAERLARSILDTVTVERLQVFAAECRTQAKILNKRTGGCLTCLCWTPRMVTPGLRQDLPIAIEKAASVRRTFGLRNIRQASS